MGAITEEDKRIDVICQFTREALIIPIKIKCKDNDGVYQEYKIKGYKELPFGEETILPNGVHVKSNLRSFKVRIESFGKYIDLNLFYNSREALWRISPTSRNFEKDNVNF